MLINHLENFGSSFSLLLFLFFKFHFIVKFESQRHEQEG